VLLPVAVHCDGRTAPGFTQNLSGRGLFFYTEATLAEGSLVELSFTMPSEITLGESMPVRCRGRVLRSSVFEAGEKNGVAVRLDSYQYLPPEEAESMAPFARAAAVGWPGERGTIPR
jgi:PilZ domain